MPEETQAAQIVATTTENTEAEVQFPSPVSGAEAAQFVEAFEAALVEGEQPLSIISGDQIIAVDVDAFKDQAETVDIAKFAYAKVAEELKFKGDFPEWEQVSERGRDLYIEGAAHVRGGGAPRTRFEEVVSFMLVITKGVKGKDYSANG